MKAQDRSKVEAIILAHIKMGEYSWPQLSEAVRAAGINIKNWLHVRGCMQALNNENGFKRTSDLTVEVYKKA